jgi:hypothetical protein
MCVQLGSSLTAAYSYTHSPLTAPSYSLELGPSISLYPYGPPSQGEAVGHVMTTSQSLGRCWALCLLPQRHFGVALGIPAYNCNARKEI